MSVDYDILAEELTKSYSRQIECYTELNNIVNKILGKVILARGDLSGAMALFEEKQRLIDKIAQEREGTKKNVEIWQEQKHKIPSSELTDRLNTVLEETEDAIKSFLEVEDQLRKHLEHITGKGRTNIHDK